MDLSPIVLPCAGKVREMDLGSGGHDQDWSVDFNEGALIKEGLKGPLRRVAQDMAGRGSDGFHGRDDFLPVRAAIGLDEGVVAACFRLLAKRSCSSSVSWFCMSSILFRAEP